VQPTDIQHLVSLSAPTLAPDASFAVVATSRPDHGADRAVGQLWRYDLPREGSDLPVPRRLTRGIADSSPQLLPDGSAVLFLRADADGRAQVHLTGTRGGEPVQVTEAPLGVSSFVISPDGTRLAFRARVPEPGRYGTVDGLGPEAEAPRHITGIRWHANGLGYSIDRPTQVFTVALPSADIEPVYPQAPTPRGPATQPSSVPEPALQLTDVPTEHGAIAFAADGRRVLVVRSHDASAHDLRDALVSVPISGDGEETVVLAPEDGFSIDDVQVLADGTTALLASTPAGGTDSVAPDTALWLLEETGPRRLTDPETLDVGSAAGGILESRGGLLLQVLERGRVHVIEVTRDGQVATVVDGDVEVGGTAAATTPAGTVVLSSAATPTSAGELLASRVDPEPARILTDLGAGLRNAGVRIPRELEIEGRDGYPVHGWVAAPEGEGPFPLILMIHGGPYAHYGVAVFDEVQTLVAAGYAVAFCNPRGSAGYGRVHGRSIRRAMGTVDAADVLDFLDGAIAADAAQHPGRLDTERLGIMGGSYGGYLTAWTIAHDQRFRAAIVERGFLDPATFAGTSDIGSYFGDEYVGTDPEDVARQSPFAHVSGVRTPTLVIHSEQDYRCPLEQGTRYYTSLRRQGVEAEMLVFPGENHELTRSGRPRHRTERFEAVLDWFSRRL
jgi:dipeptidyl aminopeptidase/acylaminoacyl peptidase